MKLIFLGTGSALTVDNDNFHSNMLFVSDSAEKLMIDCGSDARRALINQKMSHLDIHNIYISHLHADHVGGLEWLALSHKFDPLCKEKPKLFICEMLEKDLWDKTLSGGLSTLAYETAQLETYFKVHSIPMNGSFFWEKHRFRIVQTVHVLNGFSLMPSFGLFCTINELNILITTDTQFSPPQLSNLYEKSDIIFHDCETSTLKSGVHAHYEQLVQLPADLKAKMWLYHYNSGELPSAKKDGFRGFVACGQCFDFSDSSSL